MLGIEAKRGIETACERFLKASGMNVVKFDFLWNGKTAGINFKRNGNNIGLTIIMPNIDDNAIVPTVTFNNSVAFILHELGHAWYTQNAPWDVATKNHGQFVSALINGLEDPRIELAVIKSGRANNSKSLFVELVNNILRKDGYVKPNDLKNVPFMLAIEGRRLNGYPIVFPEIVTKSKWRRAIENALIDAQNAADTADIVSIAIELNRHLHNPTNQPNQPESGKDSKDAGENGEPDGEGSGEPDGEGKGKGTGEGQSDAGEPTNPDGEGSGESDKPTGKPSKGKGKGGRNPEPNTFIESELGKHSDSISESNPRPAIGKPSIVSFNWGM